MDWAKKGATALSQTDGANDAVVLYTRALIQHPTSPDYFTQRATAFSRLRPPRHDLALVDAEYAILYARKRAVRAKIQLGQQRRVVALYGLGRYEEAKILLEGMHKWRPKESRKEKMEHDIWMAKLNTKLKGREDATRDHGIKEFPDIDLPSQEAMEKILKSQLNVDGAFVFDATEDDVSQSTTRESAVAINDADIDAEEIEAAKADAAAANTANTALSEIRHDYYQNTDNVMISFYAKKVDPKTFMCNFTPNSFEVSFPRPDDPGTTFTFSANPSFGKIDVSKSKFRVMGTKVEVTIAKHDKGQQWKNLEDSDTPKTTTKLPNPYVTKQPDVDWDKKAEELTRKKPSRKPHKSSDKAKDKKNDKKRNGDKDTSNANEDGDASDSEGSDADSEFGGDAVDGFFKKLYKGADDDTRRAMMKSFTESNGTALSTNWSEVSKGKVEEVQGKDDD